MPYAQYLAANSTPQCCPVHSTLPLTQHLSVALSTVPCRLLNTSVMPYPQYLAANSTPQCCPVHSTVPLTLHHSVALSTVPCR